jgi:hypothetical protein
VRDVGSLRLASSAESAAHPSITQHPIDVLDTDSNIAAEVERILRTAYDGDRHEFEHGRRLNNTIYLTRQPQNPDKLLGFFMVSFPHRGTQPVKLAEPSLYLGWGANDPSIRNSRLTGAMFHRVFADARAEEALLGQRLLLYYRSANPVIFSWFTRNVPSHCPRMDGSYTEEALSHVAEIRKGFGYPAAMPNQHPFLVPGVRKLRFNEQEQKRQAAFAAATGVDLAKAFGWSQERGDFWLGVCRAGISSEPSNPVSQPGPV